MSRRPVVSETISSKKTPKMQEHVGGYFNKTPSWRFSMADMEHGSWSVKEIHEDVCKDLDDPSGTKIVHRFSRSIDAELLERLKDRESTTWSDLLTQTGGRRAGTNSHNIAIKDCIKGAQDRAAELELAEDELLSLRVSAEGRVWGILDHEGVMHVVWFDRNHEICPSSKR